MTRCDPYGYGTDAGPRHLMGGHYGPEYAGDGNLVQADGIHGLGVCEIPAAGRYRLVCPVGHSGPIMDLCPRHAGEISRRMSGTCTRCVWPEQARELDAQINRMMGEATQTRDLAANHRLRDRVKELSRQMDELRERGIIATRPLQLAEVS